MISAMKWVGIILYSTGVPPWEKRGAEMSNENMQVKNGKFDIPIWHKTNLTIEEAIIYTGIGRDKLYEMTNREDCPFVLWIGNRRLIKRKVFDEYIADVYSI